MNWEDTIYECWNILKNELLKEKISSIEEFMYYIFVNLFPLLNQEKYIESYENLIKFEDKLESIIQKNIKEFKEKGDVFEPINNGNDKSSFYIYLLKERLDNIDYKKEDFPFYK